MKKFWQKVIAFCLCITVSVSAMVAPVAAVAVETIIAGLSVITAAAGAVRSLAECTSSVAEMVSALKEYQDPSVPMDSSMWIASSYWGGPDAHRTELPSQDILWAKCRSRVCVSPVIPRRWKISTAHLLVFARFMRCS